MELSYRWKLADGYPPLNKGKVFSCFACGGGSTMGYKLAGFDVLGCNEIDPRMMAAYQANHHPKYSFLEPIQTFKNKPDLPEELYHLDILDGSPPCSSFSMAGSREDGWGVEKKFREGQAEQVLDTLFFDFIDLAKRLQPRVVVAENVKGLLMGEARTYYHKIKEELQAAGYETIDFLMDASKMGIPQRRERVFFIGLRKDLCGPFMEQFDLFNEKPRFSLEFNEKQIVFKEFMDLQGREIGPKMKDLWASRQNGDTSMCESSQRIFNKESFFSQTYIYPDAVPYTLTSYEDSLVLFNAPKCTSVKEACCIGSFPEDYDFCGNKAHYIIGMSVPPLMVARIADQIYKQWLSKLEVK